MDDGKVKKFDNMLKLVNRPGMDKLLNYLHNETDFYVAPASTRFHGSYEGGLLNHSLNVYMALNRLYGTFPMKIDDENANNNGSRVIVALLHDICKANFYKRTTKNVKNEYGIWEKVPCYIVDDQMPLGHGEKSVIILQRFIVLTMEEVMAIRWHMGAYDDSAKSYAGGVALNNAIDKYPLVLFLHLADQIASHWLEVDNKEKNI